MGEKLLEEGLITPEQLRQALEVQARTGELLGQILVRLGMISREDLNRVLGLTSADEVQVGPEVLELIPENVIRRHKVFPLRREGRRLYVAMANPLDVLAIDDLHLLTGLDIEPVPMSEREVNARIERYFGLPEVERALQEIGPEPAAEAGEAAEGAEEAVVDEAPIIRLVNSLLVRAIEEEASDVHIEPYEKGVRVRYRVDGLLREVMRLPRRMMPAIVSRIKVMGNMDIAERRLPQDGRTLLRLPG